MSEGTTRAVFAAFAGNAAIADATNQILPGAHRHDRRSPLRRGRQRGDRRDPYLCRVRAVQERARADHRRGRAAVLAVQIGTKQPLVVARAFVRDDLSGAEIERLMARLRARLKTEHPEIVDSYIELDPG